jgi:hypothetical protein
VLPTLPSLYVEHEDAQAIILGAHPNLAAFADQVIPMLRGPAQNKDCTALQGLKRLGPLARGELNWIVPLQIPYRNDRYLQNLLGIVGAMGAEAGPPSEPSPACWIIPPTSPGPWKPSPKSAPPPRPTFWNCCRC